MLRICDWTKDERHPINLDTGERIWDWDSMTAAMPNVSHGICPDCLVVSRAKIADLKAARGGL